MPGTADRPPLRCLSVKPPALAAGSFPVAGKSWDGGETGFASKPSHSIGRTGKMESEITLFRRAVYPTGGRGNLTPFNAARI